MHRDHEHTLKRDTATVERTFTTGRRAHAGTTLDYGLGRAPRTSRCQLASDDEQQPNTIIGRGNHVSYPQDRTPVREPRLTLDKPGGQAVERVLEEGGGDLKIGVFPEIVRLVVLEGFGGVVGEDARGAAAEGVVAILRGVGTGVGLAYLVPRLPDRIRCVVVPWS